jgi:hypothetical protein
VVKASPSVIGGASPRNPSNSAVRLCLAQWTSRETGQRTSQWREGAWRSRWRSALWPWPLASPPRNSAGRTRRPVRAMAFTPAPTPLLVASRRKAWRGVTGQRRHPRIGVGVTGGARAGGRIGLRGRFWPGDREEADRARAARRRGLKPVGSKDDHPSEPSRGARNGL